MVMSKSPALACPIMKKIEPEAFRKATKSVEKVTTMNTVSRPSWKWLCLFLMSFMSCSIKVRTEEKHDLFCNGLFEEMELALLKSSLMCSGSSTSF
jgi:hypothetical protein